MSATLQQTAHQPAGPRRVRYELCLSVLVATVRWRSAAHDTTTAWERVFRGLLYSAACLALGPWGLPWGPVVTLAALWTNLTGGTDAD